MFKTKFDDYACVGDYIECQVDDFTVLATIHHDDSAHIDDRRNINKGCNDEQQARAAWLNNEWCYCGIVLTVSKCGVELDDSHSLWGVELNYPGADNSYLLEVANGLLTGALESARAKIAELCAG